MSILKVNSIEPANAGSEDYFLARAWASIDQTGTQSLNASGNISSITDAGLGYTSVTMSSAMIDASYAVVYGDGGATSNERQHASGKTNVAYTSSVFNVYVVEGGVAASDHSNVSAVVVR